MPGRHANTGDYRYGFNGKEMDNEVKGDGAQYDYGFRIYDPRLGKFLSTDPLFGSYPALTPYQYASNTPIAAVDLDGLEALIATDYATIEALSKEIKIAHSENIAGEKYLFLLHHFGNASVFNIVMDGASEDAFKNANNEIVSKEKEASIGFWDKIDIARKNNISYGDMIFAKSNLEDIKAIKNITYEKRGFQLKDLGKFLALKIKNTDLLIADKNIENSYGLTNTFRHVAGQAMITFFFGAKTTDFIADKHELKKVGLADGSMPKLDVQEKIDTYVDLVNNAWGQKLGETFRRNYSGKDTYTSDDARNILNGLVDYFNNTWEEPLLNNYDPEKSKDDKRVIKAFTEFLNYAKEKSN